MSPEWERLGRPRVHLPVRGLLPSALLELLPAMATALFLAPSACQAPPSSAGRDETHASAQGEQGPATKTRDKRSTRGGKSKRGDKRGARRDPSDEDGDASGDASAREDGDAGSRDTAGSGQTPPTGGEPDANADADAGDRDPVRGNLIARPRPRTDLGLTPDEANTIAVYDAAVAATVYVTQRQVVRDRWSMRPMEVPSGSGTGVVWDEHGHIVTNFHVIAGATAVTVTTHDGRSHDATFIGGDPHKDLAVLSIRPQGSDLRGVRLPPEGEPLRVGQKTLAIGNPFGLDHTLTVGVVSALDREIQGFGGLRIRGMIQTDADINPGNSGGPLLDSRGRLIGVNTMIFSNSGSSAGIGFAVPIDTVRRIVPELIAHGRPIRAGIGVSVVDDRLARANGITGVVIERVEADSPAALAGLQGLQISRGQTKVGDIIIALDGTAVRTTRDLLEQLDDKRPGDEVTLTLRRGDATLEAKLTLTSSAP